MFRDEKRCHVGHELRVVPVVDTNQDYAYKSHDWEVELDADVDLVVSVEEFLAKLGVWNAHVY